ncbi:MAG: universal stress protein [Actinobacteria bacterium]|nr:universal stress protein [Actinomycetota bacterium]
MKIVVGVDGSDHSRAALAFAAEEARAHQARLQAVSAWHVATAALSGPVAPPLAEMQSALEEAARTALAESIDGLEGGDQLEIESTVREGHPAEVLIELGQDADLLVVGTRGLGGFRGVLLGSVSQHCAQHAPCPTVVVPSGG